MANIELQDGALRQDGETLATVSPEGLVLHTKPITPTIKKQIKKVLTDAGHPFLSFALDEPTEETPEADTAPPLPEPLPPAETPAPVDAPPSTAASSDPEPPQHPSLGQKDPAWLAWKQRQER